MGAMTDNLMTIQDLMQHLRVTTRKPIYDRVKRGQLPRPVNPKGRPVVWRQSEVEAALAKS